MKTPRLTPQFRSFLLFILFTFIIFSDSGCVVAIRTNAAQGATEESVPPHATLHRYFWGLVWNTEYLANDCPSKALQEIHVKSTFWESVVSILTLGIYCPVDISWVCAKEDSPRPVHHN